jgi:hypothetical protein
MFAVAVQDLNIALADESGTLRVSTRHSPTLGNTYFAIEDDRGIIEACLSQAEADDRIAEVRRRMAR